MDETIIFPSPNWFHSSVFAASSDNWLIYGGPSKSLCVLEPITQESQRVVQGNQGYRAHVLNRAHLEKIVCVDISPEWPTKRLILTGSVDGAVKQWSLEKVQQTLKCKATLNHEIHSHEKEEVVGVGYCNNGFAVTVGCYGQIVKWDLTSNVMKTFKKELKSFKPVCMACSPHIHLTVAIGTRQGVVIVLDLNGAPRVLYKVRGHDDEIMKVGWCPQYEVIIRKSLNESEKKSFATERMEKIRQEPELPEVLEQLDERVKKSAEVEYFMDAIAGTENIGKEDEPSNHDKDNDSLEQSINEGASSVLPITEQQEKLNDSSEQPQQQSDLSKQTEKENGSAEQPQQQSDLSKQPEKENGSAEQPQQQSDLSKQPEKEADSAEQPEKQNSSLGAIVTNDAAEQSAKPKQELDESGIGKTLPDDSFDRTAVLEDDMFDIYVDHEADEFGHKKFQPIDILVKVPEEKKDDDFLSECLKLKEVILMRKNEPEPSIGALVDALDKTHVDDGSTEEAGASHSESGSDASKIADASKLAAIDSSAHVQKHLLATISKHGSVRIWSKTGKLVASCAVTSGGAGKNQKNQRNQKNSANWTTLLWYKPDVLLLADGKNQLLECNALKMDCRAKLEWKVLVQQKRSIYTLATGAPRAQPAGEPVAPEDGRWCVWMTSQDRTLAQYSVQARRVLAAHNTSGGFIYTVHQCPYDARKIAVSVGDGGVRIWEASISDEDETKLSLGPVSTYWNNVQGKVLTVAWHPTRENWLAFGTAESRVGLIDANGIGEKPAKVLLPAVNGGVYALCWGDGNDLYACSGGEMVVYHSNKADDEPTPVHVELDGQKWEINTMCWYAHALVCGSAAGAVAVMTPGRPHVVTAATFVYSKLIHTVDWHPQEISTATEQSPYKNLIAVCSLDRVNTIVILEYGDKQDGTKQLSTWKTLSGHKNTVLKVAWNPHADELLLSTSQDSTVRIWNVTEGVCVSIFDGHSQSSLGAAWSAFPQHAGTVLTGGGDCCLRLWDMAHYPADKHQDERSEAASIRDRRRRHNKDKKKKAEVVVDVADEETESPPDNAEAAEGVPEGVAAILSKVDRLNCCKRFLLPMTHRQTNPCTVAGIRKLLKKYLQSSGDGAGMDVVDPTEDQGLDYLKLFGTINEVNELLDDEMERHQDTGNLESYMMLCIFRGHIDAMVKFASQRDLLDPFLVGMAPCVSFKYWKDVVQLYLAQIDRIVAKGLEFKLSTKTMYGGAAHRKAAALLSIHDVTGAVAALMQAGMFKEAYVLCRIRYIDSLAGEILQKWAEHCSLTGNRTLAAACYIVSGKLSQAATILSKSSQEDILNLAADLAKVAGQSLFVDHIEKKKELLKTIKDASQNETGELKELPSRVEQLLLTQEETPSREEELTLEKAEMEEPLTQAKEEIEDPLTQAKEETEEPLTQAKEEMEVPLMQAKEEMEVPLTQATEEIASIEEEMTSAQEEMRSRQEEVLTNTQKINALSSQMEQMLKDHTQNVETVIVKDNGDSVNGCEVNVEAPTNGEHRNGDQHKKVEE